jgi:hypothetical protein
MSDLIRFATARQQSRAELHTGWLDGGTLVIYTAPVPADADTALSTQTALATFVLSSPAGTVTDGVLTGTPPGAALVAASDTAAWARAYDSTAGVIGDYDLGGVGSGAAIELDNLNLVAGAYATVISFMIAEG